MTIERNPERLKNNQAFRQVYDMGTKFHGPFFSVFVLKNDLGIQRFGVTVTRKIGCAVVRNRCKRRLREIIKEHLSNSAFKAGFDSVINVKPALITADFKQIEKSFAQGFEWIRRRIFDV